MANDLSNEEEDDESVTLSDHDEAESVNIADVESQVFKEEEQFLANAAFIHGRTFNEHKRTEMMNMLTELRKGELEEAFDGIRIDTCANRSSVMSLNQYRAYCSRFQVPMKIDRADRKTIRGIGGKEETIGSTIIPVPFKGLGLILDVKFAIVKRKVPSLLCMRDMKQTGLDISIQDELMKFRNLEHPLSMENYFLIHRWEPNEMSFVLYTEQELRKLHRTFGHPSVSAFMKVLRSARPDEMTKEVKDWITDITRSCVTCQTYASKPKRFKITVGTDDLRFNHIVAVDIMYISKKPVLHVVDEATHFSAALFLTKVSSNHVWKAFLKCWSRVYMGPPDHMRVDQGSQFISKEFLDDCEAEGIMVLPAPVESPSTMSHVERYHAPLRSAYTKIRESLPRSESDAECLQMAIKSVNDTIGPEGLCPSMLVFGSLPRPARNLPSDTQIARAHAIDKAMKEVRKEQAKRRVAFGLKTSGGPLGKESSESLRMLPAGSQVMVYRKDSKKWEGPYTFIHIDNETVTVQLPHGRKIFRSNVVKPFTSPAFEPQSEKNSGEGMDHYEDDNYNDDIHMRNDLAQALFTEDNERFDCFTTKVMHRNEDHTFQESRRKELSGLNRNVFEVVDRSSVPKGARIFGTRWIDALKTVDGKTYEKSRIVARNFRDKEAGSVATKAPTVTRIGLRMSVSLAAMFPEFRTYLRDISQAYTQSSSDLIRHVFLRPLPEMGVPDGKVLKAVKPLYGIPEAGLYWFVTYCNHHKKSLQMRSTSYDPCVLFSRSESSLTGLTVLQVDDSFGFGSEEFLQREDDIKHEFISKEREVLSIGQKRDFNGLVIEYNKDGSYGLTQSNKTQVVKHSCKPSEFFSERAKIQYIANCTRPDLCAASQLLAIPESKLTDAHYKKMKHLVERCKSTAKTGLKYVPLDDSSLRIMLFTDASFANTHNLKSQIGFVVVLSDKDGKANIIHYGSSRCKRIARSVMAAEILGMIYGFDNAYIAKSMIEEILGCEVPIDCYVDSRTLFNVVARFASTLEKRLQIDVLSLREAHDAKDIRSIAWIPGKENIADGLTKGLVGDAHPLWKLMKSNKVSVRPCGWIERSSIKEKVASNLQAESLCVL